MDREWERKKEIEVETEGQWGGGEGREGPLKGKEEVERRNWREGGIKEGVERKD